MGLTEDKYFVVKNAISKDVCKIIAKEFKLLENMAHELNLPRGFGTDDPVSATVQFPYNDGLIENSFAWYSPLCFEALSDVVIKSAVESAVGEEVYPTYSYARIYYNGASMRSHTDRAASDVVVTCCISVDNTVKPWPIGFLDKDNNSIFVEQEPGDIVIYKGNEIEHWREKYEGAEQIQCFLSYVLKNGPKAGLRYDTRPALGMPWNTRALTTAEQNKIFLGN
jgi:hypothetical protein